MSLAYMLLTLTLAAPDRHIGFVSAMPVTIGFNGIAAADEYVTIWAHAAGLRGPWKAILSDSTQDARDLIQDDLPIYNTAGELVANSWDEVFTNLLVNDPFRFDEHGNLNEVAVWTGSTVSGTSYDTPVIWPNQWFPGVSAVIGYQSNDVGLWMSGQDIQVRADHRFSLYGISVPEPSVLLWLVLAAISRQVERRVCSPHRIGYPAGQVQDEHTPATEREPWPNATSTTSTSRPTRKSR